ncbi:unnamed protein product, partial [Didymodactylos carnosus]
MINIGIIGVGRIGRVHGENISRYIRNARIKTIADPYLNDEQIIWATRLGIQNWTKCYKDILTDNEIHAVLICSPTDTHCEIAIDCIHAGKHIFCEKPIDKNIIKIYNVIYELEKYNVKFQVGFNRRFDHNFKAIKQAIQSHKIGQPHILRITSRDPYPPT